jgi:2-iminobutanoate/2-iminopropanoate deaminase
MEVIVTRKIVKTMSAPQAIGPYSQAVEAGGFVFMSGQIPIDPKTGNLVQGDVKIQTNQVMLNAQEILKAAGCSMQQVVKSTIYLKNMADFGIVNEVYGGYFLADPPARATVEVSRLPKDVAIEIDLVAWKG